MPHKNGTARRSPSRDTSADKRTNATAAAVGQAVVPWTFLTNHAHVLIVLHSEPDLVLREVAMRVGITERAVQRIVQELEEEGYLTRERVGRRNHYHIIGAQNLRHPIESHCTIDEVLKLINSPRASKKRRA